MEFEEKPPEEPSEFDDDLLMEPGLRTVIGQNDLLDQMTLEQLFTIAMNCTGRVWVPSKDDGKDRFYGTGFLIGQGLFLTNSHVITDQADVESAEIWLDYSKKDGPFRVARGLELLATSPEDELDYTILRIKVETPHPSGMDYPCIVDLRAPGPRPKQGDNTIIVQHPFGRPRQVVARDTDIVSLSDPYFHYRADTDFGSSGAPVFDPEYRIIGLHHGSTSRGNRGIDIRRIVQDAGKAIPASKNK